MFSICLNPYFTGLSILIEQEFSAKELVEIGLNPYFTGLSILILSAFSVFVSTTLSQSLFYWIIYSYPFCQESLLFIVATEFFSDIKIVFFSIFLVIFC